MIHTDALQQAAKELKCLELLQNNLAIFDYCGMSMFPLFREGDKVVIQSYQNQLPKIGDVIVFQRGNQLVLHRLIKIAPQFSEPKPYLTKGDNCAAADLPLNFSDILGKAIRIDRGDTQIRLNSLYGWTLKLLLTFLSQLELKPAVESNIVKKIKNLTFQQIQKEM
ncbi:MAG: signal peptidase I [Deltaproteobacteria bacterium]